MTGGAGALARAARLGREHGMARMEPYGDLGDAGSALLMDAVGETGPTTRDNHPRRAALIETYTAWWGYGRQAAEAAVNRD